MSLGERTDLHESELGGSAIDADVLLTAEEVAALLQVTCSWVYDQTRRQRIPHLRLGRYVRYRREALDAWMRQVEMTSSSPASSRANGRRTLR